ncbi:MAG TPA: hypothetical protein VF422_09910 [Dokdonella sp.]
MSQPRRRFLQQFALAGAALALVRTPLAQAASKVPSPAGYSAFASQVGRRFTATDASGSTTVLTLAKVGRPRTFAGRRDPVMAREQCFTLVFECDAGTSLPEAIYTLGAVDVEPFEALVSPFGDRGRYQVVFNRT